MSVYMSITVESRSQHRSNKGAVGSTPTWYVDIYSDTSPNEDNSFRNHIR